MKKLTLSLILAMSALGSFADDRPNIILFLTDDQMRNSTGVYGNEQVKTPTMDKLAINGAIFANNYATTSICMASRACIMTGMYEYKTGCNFGSFALSKKNFEKAYPVLLREAGYYTGFAGKFGFAVKEGEGQNSSYGKIEDIPVDAFDWFAGGTGQTHYMTSKNKGIAQYADKYPHSTRAYGAACSDFIRQAKATGKPFCLSMSFKAPHKPNDPDPFFDDVYKDVVWKEPKNFGRENGKHLAPQSRLGRQYNDLFKDFGYEDDYQNTTRKYMQLIHGVDYAINMILETLEKEGLSGNTVIMITSDNGYSGGAHGFGGKVLPYEEASKTPLIIYDPRVKKADTYWRNAVTANIDLAPTILDLAGVAIPDNIDGKSLREVIATPEAKVREVLPLINAWGNTGVAFTMVSENYKYIYWPYSDSKMKESHELFYIKNDSLEMINEINNPEHKTALDELKIHFKKELKQWEENCLDLTNYTRFVTIFNQDLNWDTKKAKMNKKANSDTKAKEDTEPAKPTNASKSDEEKVAKKKKKKAEKEEARKSL